MPTEPVAPSHPVSPASRLGRRRGFALLITVTLLSFIVILLLALASYTKVETAVAGNTQRQEQARQNALTGFNIALGQLQKFAGPDARVTATAEDFGGKAGTLRYTGVWNTSDATSPATWLVSGNEGTNPLAITPATTTTTTNGVALVSTNTTRTSNDILARLMPITAPGVPGAAATASTTIGRYAWWVGDQGVKAPVAQPDRTATSTNYTYTPFASADLRRRIRQQVSQGAGAADSAGANVFESRDTSFGSPNNATMSDNTLATNQLAFFRTSASATVGLTRVQQNFHAWSPNNANVLASTNPEGSGLRRDLSLRPDLLGSAFAAWANYNAYMEDPANPLSPPPLQEYAADPVRRRYRMTARIEENGLEHRVAPVLSFFGISFSVRNDAATNPTALQVSARCVVGLWNPYSAALVPEDLEILVTGLPEIEVQDGRRGRPPVNLQDLFATGEEPLKFSLPFTSNEEDPDRSSWLPGRVYNWSALSNTTVPEAGGNPMEFYRRDAATTGTGVVRNVPGFPMAPDTFFNETNFRRVAVQSPQVITITLRRAGTGEVLGTFRSPAFDAFITAADTTKPSSQVSDFAYVFRLPDRGETPAGESAAWLQAPGRDPREFAFPADGHNGYVLPGGISDPTALVSAGTAGFPASYPTLLLDRPTTALSYNEDVPIYELPRMPLLTLGSLQHLQVTGARPFAVGNSWGGARNAWFDQFYFSGLTPDVAWNDPTKPLPNPALRVLRRKPDGTTVAAIDINGDDRIADGFSSKHLLQTGAFNVNSVSKVAWAAVLRGVRFLSTNNFTYLNLSTSTGTTAVTSGDSTTTISDPALTNSRVAAFARFAQSAQETYEADDGYSQVDPAGDGPVLNTPLYRRGIRFLTSAQVSALANAIVTLVQRKHADSGPFTTLEQFLGPAPLFADAEGNDRSLLEEAIETAGLNSDANLGLTDTTGEFSSSWLTQADIMTALAPVLFTRSDTFVIRAYGETVNPATGNVEGRAWCEALVQRHPEYLDKSQSEETAPADLNDVNAALGRRFKVMSFRWLTKADI